MGYRWFILFVDYIILGKGEGDFGISIMGIVIIVGVNEIVLNL